SRHEALLYLVVTRAPTPPDVVVLALTAETAASYTDHLRNTAHGGVPDRLEGPPNLARNAIGVPHTSANRTQRDSSIMARTPAPTKIANGTTNGHNGHDTNGNGAGNGNGNGAKTKTSEAYLQLKEGQQRSWPGLTIERRFTRPDVHPYDTVEWDLRDSAITNEHGQVVFEQKDLEFPKSWSALATNVVASKYFRGHLGTPEREHSVRQMIGRVADTIT